MKTILDALHDIWCAVSKRCHVRRPLDDPYIRWMRDQETASIRARQNFIERQFLRERKR